MFKHRRWLRRAARFLGVALVAGLALVLVGSALLARAVLLREPLRAIPGTNHISISRGDCIDCHAPIAEEWRQSFHHRSLTGPYWKDVRELGYLKVFERTRKACVNCHAPANVLDLSNAVAATDANGGFGVECTPNLLREPRGVIPAARAEDVELGVDCTSCHVDQRGIVGSGWRPCDAHEVIADARFRDEVLTAETLCRTCHGAAARAWGRSDFAGRGVTCLDCHMPMTEAPSVTGGPVRSRRSHRFAGDKDPALLAEAVHASLDITNDRKTRFRLINDRVGHFLPSGGNWISVKVRVYDDAARLLKEEVEVFGKEEPLILDFWPFNEDRRIPSGQERTVDLLLPEGHGLVEAVVRYHDWMRTKTTVVTLKKEY